MSWSVLRILLAYFVVWPVRATKLPPDWGKASGLSSRLKFSPIPVVHKHTIICTAISNCLFYLNKKGGLLPIPCRLVGKFFVCPGASWWYVAARNCRGTHLPLLNLLRQIFKVSTPGFCLPCQHQFFWTDCSKVFFGSIIEYRIHTTWMRSFRIRFTLDLKARSKTLQRKGKGATVLTPVKWINVPPVQLSSSNAFCPRHLAN